MGLSCRLQLLPAWWLRWHQRELGTQASAADAVLELNDRSGEGGHCWVVLKI